MILVATSDTHTKVDLSLIPDGDVFVHAGDLMSNGYIPDWYNQLEWLAELPHKTKYFVPGNHDFHMETYPGPALQELRKIGFTVLGFPANFRFNIATLPNGMTIGGCAFVDGLDERWAFGRRTYERFRADPEAEIKLIVNKCDIVVTHAPIYGVLDDIHKIKRGDRMFRRTLDYSAHKPKHWIHGHIHEAYGNAVYGETSFHNVAMCDRNNNHVNSPLVLDL